MIKLLFLSGSTRKDSLNKKLAQFGATLANQHESVSATFIDLLDYPMPIYNGDDEATNGLPENAKALKKNFPNTMVFLLPLQNITALFLLYLKIHSIGFHVHMKKTRAL